MIPRRREHERSRHVIDPRAGGGGRRDERSVDDERRRSLHQEGRPDFVAAKLAVLSEREREVLDLILAGKQTRQISDELCVSIKTVEFHRSRIREKLGVSSLAELFHLCLDSGSAARGSAP